MPIETMMDMDWTRLWAPPDAVVFGPNDFTYLEQSALCKLTSLEQFDRLILLGEPGMGK